MGRWQTGYSAEELAMFEGLVGQTLEENGYQLASKDGDGKNRDRGRADLRMMRSSYRAYFDAKLYLKAKTPLGQVAGDPRFVVGVKAQPQKR